MEKIHIISVVFMQQIKKIYDKKANLGVFLAKKGNLPMFIINNQTIKKE